MKKYTLLLPLVLIPAIAAQAAGISTHTSKVPQTIGQASHDKNAIIAATVQIDLALTDVLLALAEKYKLKFEIPKTVDPKPMIEGWRRDCPGCKPPQIVQAGYAKLETMLTTLRSYLDGKATVATVKQAGREALLLSWTLKGYALLAESRASEDDIRRAASSGRGTIGEGLTTEDWNGGMALLGLPDNWSGNMAGIADRIRNARDAGLEHPNADLGSWLTCIYCDE